VPQTLVSDSFTDTSGTALASHTGETGATWAKHPNFASSDIQISDANRAVVKVAGASGSFYYASGADFVNGYVEAVIRVVSLPGSGYAGVTGRMSTSASSFYWAIYNIGAGWQLWKAVAGTGTQLGSTSAATLTVGNDYTLRLTMNGSTISLSVGGSTLISVTDTDVASGRAGLVGYGAWTNSTGLHHDSLTMTTLDTLRGVGDSITEGSNASSAANRWLNLYHAALATNTLVNGGVGGTQIVDQTTDDRSSARNQTYLTGVTPTDYWAMFTGYNDLRYHGTNATALAQYERSLRAAIAWMSRTTANIKQASDAAWTYSASWSAATICNIGTKFRSASGATASISVSGTAITVAYVNRWGLADGGTFTVTIDGTLVGTIDTNVGSSSGYGGASPSRYNIQAERYAGLSSGSHTVEIATTSAGTVQLAFVCGTGDTDKPAVRIGAPIKMASDGYTSNSPYNNGSDVAVEMYSTVIRKLVYEARLDGRDVKFADSNTYFTLANMDTDKVHPTDAGHVQLKDAFVASNYVRLSDRQRALPQSAVRASVI